MGDVKRFLSVERSRPGEVAGDGAVGVRVDCHQHLWPPALVDALRARRSPPRLVGWRLHLVGEAPYDVDPGWHDRARRAAHDVVDGVDLALYSLSSPLGVESLDPEAATPLLAAWHDLADEASIWAAPRLREPDPLDLAATLGRDGVIGLQVPATAMATPAALEDLAPVLAVAERLDVPVLVHPGPARAVADVSAPWSAWWPTWWPALADYPAQLASAWFAWHVAGRGLVPRLRIGFVALAGLAPLHHERLAQRGGRLGALDPGVFYETSSYGTRAIDAMLRVVGVDAPVYGSDRPYAEAADPDLGEAFTAAWRVTNPHRLLTGTAPTGGER